MDTPEELPDAAHQKLQDELAAELLDAIGNASPAFFERLVVVKKMWSVPNMSVPNMSQLKLRELYRRTQGLKARHATIRQANDALIPATLERVFSGIH